MKKEKMSVASTPLQEPHDDDISKVQKIIKHQASMISFTFTAAYSGRLSWC